MKINEAWLLQNGVDSATLDRATGRSPASMQEKPPGDFPAKRLTLLPIEGGPGPWSLYVEGWTPPSLNMILSMHWSARAKVKKNVAKLITGVCLESGVTIASGRRRVSLEIGYRLDKHEPDDDNSWKFILDCLVLCGALTDDNSQGVIRGTFTPVKKFRYTRVILEDFRVKN